MENVNLFLLRLILACVLLSVAVAGKYQETSVANKSSSSAVVDTHRQDFYLKPSIETPKHSRKTGKHSKKSKKSKRNAYRDYGKWASKSFQSNFGSGEYSNNLPLYLVYNRKVGAYYPFYKYPNENSFRRRSHVRRVPEQ